MSADNNVWLTRMKDVIKTIREAIKPELAIPAGEDDPINYRIVRLRSLLKKVKSQHQEWYKTIEHIDTNLEGLLAELNPNETLREPVETVADAEPEPTTEEPTKDHKKDDTPA